jgi:hypothetical protein
MKMTASPFRSAGLTPLVCLAVGLGLTVRAQDLIVPSGANPTILAAYTNAEAGATNTILIQPRLYLEGLRFFSMAANTSFFSPPEDGCSSPRMSRPPTTSSPGARPWLVWTPPAPVSITPPL